MSKTKRIMVTIYSDALRNSGREPYPIPALSSYLLFEIYHTTVNFFPVCGESLCGGTVTRGC